MAVAHWLDYLVFGIIMVSSLITGIFFSFKQHDTEDYLYGRRKMSILPVSASLVVSFVSAVTMMGIPAEVYNYGVQFIFLSMNLVGMWLAAITFVPLYHPLRLTSVYQYLQMRFNSKALVILGYALGTCTANLFMGLILYAPATGLESVIGFPTWINIIGVSVVCTIYTSIGGMKAVLWNDTFQALVMVAGLVVVTVGGLIKVGGLEEVWYELEKRDRTTVNFVPDPTLRMSVWFGLVAIISNWGLYSNQPAMMRYEAVPTIRQAQLTLLIGSAGLLFINFMAVSSGAVVLAYYSKSGCDPLASGAIDSANQIIPYFLVDALGVPGFSGLFLAAIVASSLSSISSMQNAMAAVFWKEIFLPIVGEVSTFKETLILKLLVVFFGIVSTVIAFGAKFIGGTLVQISMLVISISDAPPIGIFFLGAMFAFTGKFAAFLGCIGSIALCLSLHLGRFFTGVSWPQPLPINENCTNVTNTNETATISVLQDHYTLNSSYTDTEQDEWTIFAMTPYLFHSLGVFATIVFGLLLSILPCFRQKEHVNPNLLFPFLRGKQDKLHDSNINNNGELQMDNVNLKPITKLVSPQGKQPEEKQSLMNATVSSGESIPQIA